MGFFALWKLCTLFYLWRRQEPSQDAGGTKQQRSLDSVTDRPTKCGCKNLRFYCIRAAVVRSTLLQWTAQSIVILRMRKTHNKNNQPCNKHNCNTNNDTINNNISDNVDSSHPHCECHHSPLDEGAHCGAWTRQSGKPHCRVTKMEHE